jgi:hypothetical protein
MRLVAFIKTMGWAILFVVFADVVINLVFRMPVDPRVNADGLRNYFEYGRSVEGKLKRSLGSSDKNSSILSAAGWLSNECHRSISKFENKRVISFYGMSFSNDVGRALVKIDSTFLPIFFAGPAAPPNHTYSCFRTQQLYSTDKVADYSEIQVFGVLASSVKGMLSMTGATTGFESPAPYTYPRYHLNDKGELIEIQPLINSAAAWRKSIGNKNEIEKFKSQLAEQDMFFLPFLFNENWSDDSSLIRMIRRAYAQRQIRFINDSVLEQGGFVTRTDIGPVLSALLLDFSKRSKAAGKRPIVLLLQDGHSSDALFRLLGPILKAEGIEFVSSHDVVQTSDPSNFIADGHFTEASNERVASLLQRKIKSVDILPIN